MHSRSLDLPEAEIAELVQQYETTQSMPEKMRCHDRLTRAGMALTEQGTWEKDLDGDGLPG